MGLTLCRCTRLGPGVATPANEIIPARRSSTQSPAAGGPAHDVTFLAETLILYAAVRPTVLPGEHARNGWGVLGDSRPHDRRTGMILDRPDGPSDLTQ
jgi:hypothetical protein